MDRVLLYIGAGTDVRPIQRYSHIFNTFVYVDGLPSSNYYENRPVTKEGMFEDMKKHLKVEDCPVEWASRASGEHSPDIIQAGNSKIIYFFDTKDTDMWQNVMLSNLLDNCVTVLYVKGYSPTIVKPLPRLKKIIHTDYCFPQYGDNGEKWKFDDKVERTSILDYDDLGGGGYTFFTDCEECETDIRINGV